MAKNRSGRKPGSRPQTSIEIVSQIHLRLQDLGKLSSSSFHLGQRFYWLGAYCTDQPLAGRVQHTGVMQGEEHTPPWRICGASSWAELYRKLVELEGQGSLTSVIILYPALGEMPRFLKDNFSEFEDYCQAVAKAEGIEDFPRNPERINELITAAHRSWKGSQKGGASPKKKKGILSALEAFLSGKPDLTCKKAWDRFPDSWTPLPITTPDGESFDLYRAGEHLTQVDDKTGKEASIKFRTFKRYFAEANKQVNRNSKNKRDS